MNFENILFDRKNSIAYVTVNRPKVLNALDMSTMDELRTAFHEIKRDVGVRAVILTGSRKGLHRGGRYQRAGKE
jgi:enoyl-CoA hydratase